MSLISVLLEVCRNGCYSQDAGVTPVKPQEGLLALCATSLSSPQRKCSGSSILLAPRCHTKSHSAKCTAIVIFSHMMWNFFSFVRVRIVIKRLRFESHGGICRAWVRSRDLCILNTHTSGWNLYQLGNRGCPGGARILEKTDTQFPYLAPSIALGAPSLLGPFP